MSWRDVDMVGEDLVIIMEYIEGIALSSMIRLLRDKGSSIPLPVVVRILVDALRGLHAAHELTDESGAPMRIVHRDVSPHNVLVGADGVARVADFGVATSVGRLAQTRTGDGVHGKLQYLAPDTRSSEIRRVATTRQRRSPTRSNARAAFGLPLSRTWRHSSSSSRAQRFSSDASPSIAERRRSTR